MSNNGQNHTQCHNFTQGQSQDSSNFSAPRDFKGIWIPKEIWLDRSLTYFEKCLLAEIHSLDGEKGCYASNEYLCNFFNEKERKIQDGLAKLKAKGYVYVQSFDGRTRILRTNLYPNKEPQNDKSLFSTSEVQKPEVSNHYLAPLGCEIPHPAPYIRDTSKEHGGDCAHTREEKNPQKISYLNINREKCSITETEVFSYFIKAQPSFTADLIQESLEILKQQTEPIRCVFKYLDAIIQRLKTKKGLQKKEKSTKVSSKNDDDIPYYGKETYVRGIFV